MTEIISVEYEKIPFFSTQSKCINGNEGQQKRIMATEHNLWITYHEEGEVQQNNELECKTNENCKKSDTLKDRHWGVTW